MRPVVIINPLAADLATGMGVAGEGLRRVLPEETVRAAPGIDAGFRFINGLRPAALRQAARVLFAQVCPWLVPRDTWLLFSSHHAPLWRTGRHIVIINDLIALRFPDQSPGQTRYYRHVLPRVARAATRVVTLSAAVRDELASAYPGTPAAAATVIPAYSARLDGAQPGGRDLAARRAGGRLAVVGARYAHKNLALVLTALRHGEAAGLSLIASGAPRSLWPGLVELEAAGRARVLEHATAAELDELYGSALALVYPSLAEGQGLPPLEAMAAGCPVVCADLPILRETCGDAAAYVDPGDAPALARLLGRMRRGELDGEVSQRIEAGRRRVTAFGRAALQSRWRAFLEERT